MPAPHGLNLFQLPAGNSRLAKAVKIYICVSRMRSRFNPWRVSQDRRYHKGMKTFEAGCYSIWWESNGL